MADPASLVPRMSGLVDPERIRGLPLAPADGFLLSRIDGRTNVGDLAQATGLSVEDVVGSLLKLESLRLIEISKSAPEPEPARPPLRSHHPPPRQASPPAPGQSLTPRRPSPPPQRPSPRPRPAVNPTSPPPQPPTATRPSRAAAAAFTEVSTSVSMTALTSATTPATPAAAAVPDGEIDLEPAHRKQITELYARLDSLDHYALLGVSRAADKKAIKRAYFELTTSFHPDRFFRRKLGALKLQMETIFGRMTEAHDTLTAADRRAEYDAYIGSVEKTRGIEAMLADALTEMKRAEEAALGVTMSSAPPPPSSSTALSGMPPSTPASQLPPSSRTSSPNLGAFIDDALSGRRPTGAPPGPKISIPPPKSDPSISQDRREMLARRLRGAGFRAPAAPRVPTIGQATKTEEAVESLKRRYEEKIAAARGSQAKKYSDTGLQAKAKGDLVAAANAFRVAMSFDPDNDALRALHAEAQRAADTLLADQYLKQAEYEERSDKWADAARSWARVARARTEDVRAHERAAHCLVKADGNLHEAAALAQRAVQLSPKAANVRVTLANVYLAAGLGLNAKRELEAAAVLAPNDANVAALLKRLSKPA